MKKHITGVTVATRVRMLRSAHKGAFLIVEGPTDARALGKFVDSAECRVEIAFGKDNVLHALSDLASANFRGAVGVVDADFWHLNGDLPVQRDLCVTETHDLETMMIKHGAMQPVIAAFGGERAIVRALRKRGRTVEGIVVELGLSVGYLRWASQVGGWGLRFAELPLHRVIDSKRVTLDARRLIELVKAHSNEEPVASKVIRARMVALMSEEADPWQVCCGHDLSMILAVVLSIAGVRPAGSDLEELAEDIERGLAEGFDRDQFRQTGVYAQLHAWADDNHPFHVLGDTNNRQVNWSPNVRRGDRRPQGMPEGRSPLPRVSVLASNLPGFQGQDPIEQG